MPFKSKAQAKAMYAAVSGKSTLGIPKKVGEEFVKESKGLKGKRWAKLKEFASKKKGY